MSSFTRLGAIVAIMALFATFFIGETNKLFASEDSCKVTKESSGRKMDEERKREEERRKESYPDPESELSLFEECLGNIYRDFPFPSFPKIPTMDDLARDLCRELRKKLPKASSGFPLEANYGHNLTLPWRGTLSEDIWNALR
jgi:hypothetical protein